MDFRPIETEHRGHRFRSRKEARFATMFDALGIRWEYEPEGYELGNGNRYLPDFRLPDQGLWVEVKGKLPTVDEFEKATRLAQGDPDSMVIITWENFDWPTSQNNIAFWTDRDGVFHSQRGWRWLNSPEEGWAAARAARFDGSDGNPLWRNYEPRAIEVGELPY